MKTSVLSLLAGVTALGFVSATQAADLIIEEPMEVGVIDVGGDWDGVFIGGFVGYGWGDADDVNDELGLEDGDQAYDLSGWLAGVTLGANVTISDGIVAGVVGDLAWADLSAEEYSIDALSDTTFGVNWLGSLRGRLGFDGGAFLPYLTAGLAVANATHTTDGEFFYEDSQTHIGWTVGAGVEFAVADNVSLDLFYRYSDYGSKEYDTYYPATEIGLKTHTLQVGVNFAF